MAEQKIEWASYTLRRTGKNFVVYVGTVLLNGQFTTLDKAKEAAEAHYNKRVRDYYRQAAVQSKKKETTKERMKEYKTRCKVELPSFNLLWEG